jgi:ABC-type transport system involved in multi-copper enzyme maturation permease subunit
MPLARDLNAWLTEIVTPARGRSAWIERLAFFLAANVAVGGFFLAIQVILLLTAGFFGGVGEWKFYLRWFVIELIPWATAVMGLALLSRRYPPRIFGPVLFYDLVRTARRVRFTVVRTIYAAVLAIVLGWMGLLFLARYSDESGFGMTINHMAEMANIYFSTFMVIQFIVVVVLTPAYVAGAVAEEKERKTLEFILATDLRNREIILGKFVSRVFNLSFLLLAGLPIISFLQFLGGVSPGLVFAGFLATALSMFSLAGLSILNSVMCRRARDAIVLTYLGFLVYYLLASLLLLVKPLSSPFVLPGLDTFPSEIVPGWKSPIELWDVVKAINCGNIFWAVFGELGLGPWGTTPVLEDELPRVLRNYAIVHGCIGLLCLGWSILRLRVIALREASGNQERSSTSVAVFVVAGVASLLIAPPLGVVLLVWYFWPRRGEGASPRVERSRKERAALARTAAKRPPVGKHPMIWKEVFAEGRMRLNAFGRIILLALVGASFVPTAIILYLYFDDNFGRWGNTDPWKEVGMAINSAQIRFVGTVVMCLMILAVVVRAAGSVHSERERHTLDELLTTPLTTGQIIFAKWLGAVASVRWGWVWLGLIWGIGVITGGLEWWAVPLLIVSWLVYATIGAGIGLWFSTGTKSTLRASVAALMSVLFLYGGYWLVLGLCCFTPFAVLGPNGTDRDFSEMMYKVFWGQTPPLVMGLFGIHGEEFSHRNGYQSTWMYEITTSSLFGLGLWAAMIPVLWLLICQRFRQQTGRIETVLAQRPTPISRRKRTAPALTLKNGPVDAVVVAEVDHEPVVKQATPTEDVPTALPADEPRTEAETGGVREKPDGPE